MNSFFRIRRNLVLIVTAFLFMTGWSSCKDEENSNPASIKIVESSVPTEMLSSEGGSVTLKVEWGYTLWKILPGNAVEGDKFISGSSIDFGGGTETGNETSDVTIYFRSNPNLSNNQQYLIIQSLDGAVSDKIILTQKAKDPVPTSITIDPATTYQTITGFGGANAIWGTDYLNNNEMDLAFGTDNGIGLSIFRVRLSSNKNDWAGLVNTIKYANAKNIKVLASPWSPPAAWKSNNSTNGGGYLKEEYYDDFIAYINEFIEYMTNQGAHIDVVSMQNEPDYQVSYEGCEYTSAEMLKLIKDYAGTITGAQVMAAESFNFKHSYTDNILNDADAADNLDIVGGHIYGSGLAPYPLAASKEKEVWMTEHLLNLNSGSQPNNWTSSTPASTIWDESMDMVDEIQRGMKSNWNAYIWWYIRRYYSFLGDGEKGTVRETILKRGYAMSQFAKFIRPGYIRIDAQLEENMHELSVTAYKNSNQYVLVIINPKDYAVEKTNITVPGTVSSVKSYSTSLTKNRAEESLSLADGKLTIDLEAKSITTIVVDF